MKINEVIELWKEEKQKFVKESTFAVYLLILKNHLEVFFNKENISEQSIQQFVFEKQEEGLSEKTIKDILVVLKMIIRYAIKHKYLPHFEVDVKVPKTGARKKIKTLSKQEQRKLIEHLINNFTFKNLGILIALHTGVRIGEVCALKWSDIDLELGVVSVNKSVQRIYDVKSNLKKTKIIINTPKTMDSTREIPLSNQLQKILKPLMKIVKKDSYIISNETSIIEPRTYRKHLTHLCEELNIKPINFHALRHSFATRCIESKADYKTVSALLGHANIGTTLNLYVHPDNNQKKQTIEKMLKNI